MKLYFKIVVGIILVTGNSSCKKSFLEAVDKTVILKEGYVMDLETTEYYLNGIYRNLGAVQLSATYMPYAELLADNIKPTGDRYSAVYNWAFTPIFAGNSFGSYKGLWQYYYLAVRDCSFVIEKSDEFQSENLAKAKQLRGQALAIRAMMHFYLVNVFAQSYNFTADASHAGIPLVKTSDIEQPLSRQTVAQVYSGIIEDLVQALELLPQAMVIPTKELMNYQAAKALLSRVYLFKEDYTQAKDLAVQLLKDVPLMTNGYPEKLYSINESEALFRLPPGGSVNYFPVFNGTVARLSIMLASNDIAQLLTADTSDKRKAWVTKTTNGWLITKFPQNAAGGLSSSPNNDHFHVVLRSSEMALNAAEAYAKLNMADSAQHYINLIRQRANPTLSGIASTGAALLDSIRLERRKELCFDGLRMYDLLRWKKSVDRMDALSPAAQHLPYPSNKAIAPIPQEDVSLSGLQQNTGY